MNGPTIEIQISPTGEIRLTTQGFSGATCRDASQALERALGIIQSDRPTQEMFTATFEMQQTSH